jgi:N-acetylneuraminate lyase
MTHSNFRLIAPPHSPFDADGRLHLPAVERQLQLLQQTGVDGVFVAGSTGEGLSLTIAERMALADRWVDAAKTTSLDVIVQVGDNCQAHAIQLAEHAQQVGAESTAAFAPSYFRPQNVSELIRFLEPIAAAAGDLPFYFYDIPPMTNVRLPMVDFLEQAKPRIPNLVGLKYSNTDLLQMQECLQVQDHEFEVLFGSDEILLAAVALGVHGAIGSTYNFATPLYRRMLRAVDAGDMALARDCQLQSANLVRCLMGYGFMAASKYTMSLLGVDCGPVRAPFRNLTADEQKQLRGKLEKLGLFEIANREPLIDANLR